MPTHQDHPWERDARKRAERRAGRAAPRKRPLEHPGVVWGVVAVAALVVVLRSPLGTDEVDPPLPVPAIPAAPAAVVPAPSFRPDPAPAPTPRFAGSVTDVRSRFVGTAGLEIWGTTDAVDGASVEIRISTPGGDNEVALSAPSAGGHFFASAGLPPAMRGRRVSVEARIAR